MPLKPGKSQAVISGNMHELKHGPHHAKMAKKFGAKKAHQIDVAIALDKARHSHLGLAR